MKPVLKIFVTEHCSGCVEALHIAAEIVQNYPHLGVEVINLNAPDVIIPEAVFATPTYILNDHIVSLGNPSLSEIARWASEVVVKPTQTG